MNNSAPYDLLIRGAMLVGAEETRRGDLAVRDGIIAALGPDLDGEARQTVEGSSYFLLPGYIDAHVHLNEPGRTDWEGFATGTRALAAGGCTSFIDMPLNSTPVLDGPSFDAKAACLAKNSCLDGALWGGLGPGNLRHLPELAERGVIGFKAFMSDSGMADFPRADQVTLRDGMARAADLHLPVAVHAESEEITSRLTGQLRAQGRTSIRDYLDSRPIEAELAAIGEALDLARETGCSLHIVHVSSAAGLQAIHIARESGVEVTAETCPHYLLLDEDDLCRLGPVAKCAPPLRPANEREALWKALENGRVDTIGSDHSPSPPELKASADFFAVWGGIAGCQHNYPLFFETAVLGRGLDPTLVARLASRNVARRFKLPLRGDLQVGWVADLVLLQSAAPRTITTEELLTRHRISPYVGCSTRLEVAMAFAQGRRVDGSNPEAPVRPARILRPNLSI